MGTSAAPPSCLLSSFAEPINQVIICGIVGASLKPLLVGVTAHQCETKNFLFFLFFNFYFNELKSSLAKYF